MQKKQLQSNQRGFSNIQKFHCIGCSFALLQSLQLCLYGWKTTTTTTTKQNKKYTGDREAQHLDIVMCLFVCGHWASAPRAQWMLCRDITFLAFSLSSKQTFGECFILFCHLLFFLEFFFFPKNKKTKTSSSWYPNVAFWLFSNELILTFVLIDAIAMYEGKQHLSVLNGHPCVRINAEGARRSDKSMLGWSRIHDIYCSVYHTE